MNLLSKTIGLGQIRLVTVILSIFELAYQLTISPGYNFGNCILFQAKYGLKDEPNEVDEDENEVLGLELVRDILLALDLSD